MQLLVEQRQLREGFNNILHRAKQLLCSTLSCRLSGRHINWMMGTEEQKQTAEAAAAGAAADRREPLLWQLQPTNRT